jgi:hypothetical protein
MYLSKQSQLKSMMLSDLHASPTNGNLGFTKTYERVKHSFFGDSIKWDVHTFVVEYDTFQEIREK